MDMDGLEREAHRVVTRLEDPTLDPWDRAALEQRRSALLWRIEQTSRRLHRLERVLTPSTPPSPV